MNGGGWAWILGWLAAAIGIPAALGYATTRYRASRVAAVMREARRIEQADRDAKFCASIGADWHATPERVR
jgi:predicted outer membrane lipoprotein